MFEVNGKQYDFKFNTERISVIEAAAKTAIMGEYSNTNGLFSLKTMNSLFPLAVKEVGSDKFLGQTEGAKLFEDALKERGYATIAVEIQSALMRDTPFLFQANKSRTSISTSRTKPLQKKNLEGPTCRI